MFDAPCVCVKKKHTHVCLKCKPLEMGSRVWLWVDQIQVSFSCGAGLLVLHIYAIPDAAGSCLIIHIYIVVVWRPTWLNLSPCVSVCAMFVCQMRFPLCGNFSLPSIETWIHTHTLNGRRAHPHILLFTHHDALLANDAHLLESFLLCDAYISSELQCLRPKVYVLC